MSGGPALEEKVSLRVRDRKRRRVQLISASSSVAVMNDLAAFAQHTHAG